MNGPVKPAQPQQARPASQDLNTALIACFALGTRLPAFPDRLVELVTALTNAQDVSVWSADEEGAWEPLAQSSSAMKAQDRDARLEGLPADLAPARADVRFQEGLFVARIGLPDQKTGVLMVAAPHGQAAVQSLTYERVSLLAQLSFAQFCHEDVTDQSALVREVLSVAAGQTERLQSLADLIAKMRHADFAAVALFDGDSVGAPVISGQSDGAAKRADLPKRVRQDMRAIAAQRLKSVDKMFAQEPGSDRGLVFLVEGGTRDTGVLPLAAALFAQASHTKPRRRWNARRMMRMVAVALVCTAVSFIPIPDGANLPARVESIALRKVTAPFAGVVAEVAVSDSAPVSQGDLLVRMDTREFDLERVAVLAERAAAVIDREAARASRNAAQLRNAELEVERLEARLDLLDTQRDAARLVSAIDGIVLLGDLDSRVGATVRQGDPLLEVANPDALQLELTVLESEVARISEGSKGTFRPDFDPTISEQATVSFVSPAIDERADPPRLYARATFEGTPEGLSPGVSGVFVRAGTYSPIWSVVYTNVRDWLLLRFWL